MPYRLFLLLLLALAWPVLAAPSNLLLVWLGQGQARPQAERTQLLNEIARRKPTSLVLLVHGYGVVRQDPYQPYQEVARRLSTASPRALVLGIQWDSAAPGDKVPWQTEEAYFKMISRARGVGHLALRELLLDLHQRYPKLPVMVLSHSLGCEVAAAAVYPKLQYFDDAEPTQAALAPTRPLHIRLLGLLGSDLDYDLWWKSKLVLPQPSQVELHWMTISSYLGQRDKALLVRKVSRGLAGGTALPRMTSQQLDHLVRRKALMLDGEELGESHDFVDYLSPSRLQRMLKAARVLPGGSSEMTELDRVLKAPAKVSALSPWLDHQRLAPRYYALWRLEHLLCGGSQHFSDETLEEMARKLRNTPYEVRRGRKESSCQTMRQELWPTEKQLIRAGAPDW